jgi:hypothetical protein
MLILDLVTRQPGMKVANAGIREVSMRRISRMVSEVPHPTVVEYDATSIEY